MKFSNCKIRILIFLSLLPLFGCATVPFKSQPLIDSQSAIKPHISINFNVIDGRDEKNSISGYSAIPSYKTYGDDSFDKPLCSIFKEMLIRRFGNDQNGYYAEIKLKVFSPTLYLHAVGPVLHRIECKSLLTADVGFIDDQNKYIFNKTYLIEARDIATKNAIVAEVLIGTLSKAFDKFANEFQVDIDRVFTKKE